MKNRMAMKRWMVCILAILSMAGAESLALALEYPTRPVTMVVPFTPGGGADLGSKVVAEKIAPFLGQPIISEYKPGAGGGLGAALVSKAKPDGYTLLMASATYVVRANLYKVPYDPIRDFAPVVSFPVKQTIEK